VELEKNVFALIVQEQLKRLRDIIQKESVPGQEIGVQKNWKISVMKLKNRTLHGLVQSRVEFRHVLVMKVPIQSTYMATKLSVPYQQAVVRLKTPTVQSIWILCVLKWIILKVYTHMNCVLLPVKLIFQVKFHQTSHQS